MNFHRGRNIIGVDGQFLREKQITVGELAQYREGNLRLSLTLKSFYLKMQMPFMRYMYMYNSKEVRFCTNMSHL